MSLSFSLFFRPRFVDALKGYTRQRFYQDVGAGITVGVVALPLAMAFAIASGLKPEAGLFTAIIAGFLISALGGSRVQIGGPAGAFIVIVYGILDRYGLANLIIATAMSGVMLFAMGLLRLGTLIRCQRQVGWCAVLCRRRGQCRWIFSGRPLHLTHDGRDVLGGR